MGKLVKCVEQLQFMPLMERSKKPRK